MSLPANLRPRHPQPPISREEALRQREKNRKSPHNKILKFPPPQWPEPPAQTSDAERDAQFEKDANDLDDLLGGGEKLNAGESPEPPAAGQPKGGLDIDNPEHLAKLNKAAKLLASNGHRTPEAFTEAVLTNLKKNASKVDGGLLATMWQSARRADQTLPKSSEEAFDQLISRHSQKPKTNGPTTTAQVCLP